MRRRFTARADPQNGPAVTSSPTSIRHSSSHPENPLSWSVVDGLPDQLGDIQDKIWVQLNHDHGPVIGLDDGPEVWPEGTPRTLFAGEVGAAEAAGYPALTVTGPPGPIPSANMRNAGPMPYRMELMISLYRNTTR